MTIKNLVLNLILLAVSAASVHAEDDEQEVLVRVFHAGSVPRYLLIPAEAAATKILASAGVRIRWANGGSAGNTSGTFLDTIDLRFAYSTPENHMPGALAAALPFARSGLRITVFYDRVSRNLLELNPISAAPVLAHEIGHVLLRTNDHAETGLMKAHWSGRDNSMMKKEPLAFTPAHAILIRSNLEIAGSLLADSRR